MKDYGAITVSRHYDPSAGRERFRIDASPKLALISVELLDQARAGDSPVLDVEGDRLTIADHYGQRFVYRIGDYVDHGWERGYEITREDDE